MTPCSDETTQPVQFNMMIRPTRQQEKEAIRSIDNPHHPDHWTTDWRTCIHWGCLAHETAKLQHREDIETVPPVEETTHPDHGILNWTACVSRECEIHRSEKEGAGYYPAVEHTRVLNDRPLQVVRQYEDPTRLIGLLPPTPEDSNKENQDPEVPESATESTTDVIEITPQGSEDEDSDDYDSTDDEVETNANHIQFAAEASKPVKKLILLIERYHKDAFTFANNRWWLNPMHFDNMLDCIRLGFWNHRITKSDYEPTRIVMERPPLGSQFTPNGYLMPDGVFINSSTRFQIGRIRAFYRDIHRAQHQAMATVTRQMKDSNLSRAKHMIGRTQSYYVNNKLEIPKQWAQHYIEALKEYGFPEDSEN